MTGKLTRHAYQKLIDEDCAWLEKHTPNCLERRHILDVLRQSVDNEYPPEPDDHPVGTPQNPHGCDHPNHEVNCPCGYVEKTDAEAAAFAAWNAEHPPVTEPK